MFEGHVWVRLKRNSTKVTPRRSASWLGPNLPYGWNSHVLAAPDRGDSEEASSDGRCGVDLLTYTHVNSARCDVMNNSCKCLDLASQNLASSSSSSPSSHTQPTRQRRRTRTEPTRGKKQSLFWLWRSRVSYRVARSVSAACSTHARLDQLQFVTCMYKVISDLYFLMRS